MQRSRWTILFLLFCCLPAYGSWELDSEFQLHVGTTLFNQLISDFGNSLKGEQTIPIANMLLQEQVPVQVNDIQLKVAYNFAPPSLEANSTREWDLNSQAISARLLIGSINATQTVQENFGGVIVNIILNAECHNIELDMSPNGSYVHAKLRADLVDNQVQISMPFFDANWQSGAWNLVSMECSGAQGFEDIVKAQALKALSTIHNFDEPLHAAIGNQLEKWSSSATLVLLSERELPTHRDDLHVYFDPATATDNGAGDVLLHGNLRFVYPFVNPKEDLKYSFALDTATPSAPPVPGDSYLLLPEDMIRGLIMGEYFTGHLDYSLPSSQLPAFASFMGNRFLQFFLWPDLMNFATKTAFLFEFRSLGSPSIQNLANGSSANSITATLGVPLDARMFAPKNGGYVNYVEFTSNVSGNVDLSLSPTGIHMVLKNSGMAFKDSWSATYKKLYHPNTYIALSTIGGALKKALAGQGMDFPLPSLLVGAQLKLVPNAWQLQGKNLLMHFKATP